MAILLTRPRGGLVRPCFGTSLACDTCKPRLAMHIAFANKLKKRTAYAGVSKAK